MKDLVIGGASGYNYNQLKPWVESFDNVGFVGDKVLLVNNMDKVTRDTLTSKGFTLVEVPVLEGIPIHVTRFLFIYDYLRTTYKDYRYVFTSDTRDSFCQLNPITWVEQNLGDKKLVVGSEGILYKNEFWGNENLEQTYGPYVHALFKDNITYNVGTLAGHAEYIKDLAFTIYHNAVNRPIKIVDQAVFNVTIQSAVYRDATIYSTLADGFVCHAGTVADPVFMARCGAFMLEGAPALSNDIVTNANGVPFTVVHQYDRVPEWKEVINSKFNVQ
jgi:hypothetical protein